MPQDVVAADGCPRASHIGCRRLLLSEAYFRQKFQDVAVHLAVVLTISGYSVKQGRHRTYNTENRQDGT
jgi:hypothetical protein